MAPRSLKRRDIFPFDQSYGARSSRLFTKYAAGIAVDAGVHGLGVSFFGAGHETLVPQVMGELRAAVGGKIVVVCGGVIPRQDYEILFKSGGGRGLRAGNQFAPCGSYYSGFDRGLTKESSRLIAKGCGQSLGYQFGLKLASKARWPGRNLVRSFVFDRVHSLSRVAASADDAAECSCRRPASVSDRSMCQNWRMILPS